MTRQLRAERVFVALFLLGLLFVGGRFLCASEEGEEPVPLVPPETNPPETKELIKIGFIGPLSGSEQARGEAAKNAVALATEEINNAGGIIGRNLEIISKDGACNAVQATNEFLVLAKDVSVVLSICDEESLAAALFADEKKVVLLSVGASSPDITDAGDYVFRLWPSDNAEGKAVAEYLAKQGIKTAAVIFSDTDYGIMLKTAFKKRFFALGGNVTQELLLGEEPLETQEEVVFFADGTGINDTLSGKKVFGPERIAKKMNLSYAAYDLEDYAEYRAFLEKYEKKYGKKPYSYLAANAYDAVKLIGEALEQGKDMRQYLHAVNNWQGASGVFSIDAERNAQRELKIKENI